jgi:hypothetical protein
MKATKLTELLPLARQQPRLLTVDISRQHAIKPFPIDSLRVVGILTVIQVNG